jgi:microsomal dipeptidase-like Zn-dependent dipeptidase
LFNDRAPPDTHPYLAAARVCCQNARGPGRRPATGVWFLALLFAGGVAVPVWRHRRAAAESERAEQRVAEDLAALRDRIATAKREIRDAERARADAAAAMAAARDQLVADLTTEGAQAITNRE